MDFFLCFLPYVVTAALLFWLGSHVSSREARLQESSKGVFLPWYSWEIIASILIIVLFSALRYYTGNDYRMYLTNFQQVQSHDTVLRENLESGFVLISRLIAYTGCHYSVYFGFWGALQAFCLYYGLRRHKFLYPWIGLMLFLGPFCINWISFIRQWAIAFAFILIIPYVAKKKFLPCLLFTLVAMTIHHSAWVLLLMYFIAQLVNADKDRKYYLSIFAVCYLLGVYPVWLKVLSSSDWVLTFIGYEKYQYLLEPLFNHPFVFKGYGPLRLIYLFQSLLFIWYYPEMRGYFKHDKLFPTIFVFAFIGVCYQHLFINTVYAFIRPADYLFIFVIIMLAYVFVYLIKQGKLAFAIVSCGIVCSFLLLASIKDVYFMHKPVAEYNVLYHFWLFK